MSLAPPEADIDDASFDPSDSPRIRHEVNRARMADFEIAEGDGRGHIFFGEFESRKVLTKSMDADWAQLLSKGCTSAVNVDVFETAGRSKILIAEDKEFHGLVNFFTRDADRVAKGYAEHTYVNFMAPQSKKQASSASSQHPSTTGGRTSRKSIILTSFHRELVYVQVLSEFMEEEQKGRMEILSEYYEDLLLQQRNLRSSV